MMNARQANRLLHDVANRFDVYELLEEKLGSCGEDEDRLCETGLALGLSDSDILRGFSPVPDELYNRYPLFSMLPDWRIAEAMAGRYGPQRVLKAIFEDKCITRGVPSRQAEAEQVAEQVRQRCDQKVKRINDVFPGTYPTELPVWRFSIQTSDMIHFESVYELSDAFDSVVGRFSELFFAAMSADLPERETLELNLLATFLNATDLVMPGRRIQYEYIRENRSVFQQEGYRQLTSYVKIGRVLPVWKARAFYRDSEFVGRYIERHAEAKASIRSFLRRAASYECQYTFIADMEAHQRVQNHGDADWMDFTAENLDFEEDVDRAYLLSEPVLVDKTADEISEQDRLIVERGQQMVSANRFGGVRAAQREMCESRSTRLCRRLGIPMGADEPDGRPSDFGKAGEPDA